MPKLNKICNYILISLQRIIGVFLLITITIIPCKSQDINSMIQKIVIDPGHGGKDPGNLGTGRYDKTEKHVVLDISLLFGDYVKAAFSNIEILYTRTTNEEYPTLKERTEIANKANADLFISIHCDAFKDPNAYGAGVYVMGMSKLKANMDVAMKENSVIYLEDDYKLHYEGFDPNTPESYIVFSLTQNTHIHQSLEIAEKVSEEFATRANRKSRGVKQAPFYVISRANMPSILIETGFLTNPKEEDFLHSKQGKEYLASAIFRAFRSYKESIDLSSISLDKEKNDIIEQSSNEIDSVLEKKDSIPNIIYKVQIGTYLKDMKGSSILEGLVVEEIIINKTYKYMVGNTNNKTEADKIKRVMIERGLNDAFIVAFRDGIRINVKEALSLQNQY